VQSVKSDPFSPFQNTVPALPLLAVCLWAGFLAFGLLFFLSLEKDRMIPSLLLICGLNELRCKGITRGYCSSFWLNAKGSIQKSLSLWRGGGGREGARAFSVWDCTRFGVLVLCYPNPL
jgi:hypothetical protein